MRIENPDWRSPRKKGDAAELRVFYWLSNQAVVFRVFSTPKGHWYDAALLLVPMEDVSLKVVKVEVKSNQSGVDDFHEKMRKRHKLKESLLDLWFLQNNVIVLAAGPQTQENEHELYDSFYKQLSRLAHYHRDHHEPLTPVVPDQFSSDILRINHG